MGVSLLIAVLDYEKLNPFSRVGNSDYQTIENLRMSVATQLLNSEEKYKTSSQCQSYLKNLNAVKKFESLGEKIIEKLSNIDKALAAKRSNSVDFRKISNSQFGFFDNNSSSSNNIVINNFNRNFFNLIASGKFGSEYGNSDKYEFLNDAAKKFNYDIKVGNSLMNNININNYNFNMCNIGEAEKESRKI